jgi:hypothetical protein
MCHGVRALPAPERERPADRVDRGARFLDRSIRVEQHRHDCAGRWVVFEHFEQRVQPLGLDERVRVQEEDVAAARLLGAEVRAAAEAEVLVADEDVRAFDLLAEPSRCLIGRGAVDDDQLVDRIGRALRGPAGRAANSRA